MGGEDGQTNQNEEYSLKEREKKAQNPHHEEEPPCNEHSYSLKFIHLSDP